VESNPLHSYLIFEYQIQIADRSLDFHHKPFKDSKSRVKNILIFETENRMVLRAVTQCHFLFYESDRNQSQMPFKTL
jgi:hypothetical protein